MTTSAGNGGGEGLENGDLDGLLAEARQRAEGGAPRSISIRRLLEHVGAARRGANVVGRVQRALDRHGLITDPPFTQGWIDNHVVLRTAKPPVLNSHQPSPELTDTNASAHVGLTVASLKSATGGVSSIEKTESIQRAQAKMLVHGYSQLPVMSGARKLVGAVSWEAIAMARLRRDEVTLADATVTSMPVELSDDLISLVPRVIADGFVFVLAEDRTLGGVVTTADLSEQFAILANPFFLIGEIERRLRLILARCFSVEVLRAHIDPRDPGRELETPDDLSLGEALRVLEVPENWDTLGWPLDRVAVLEMLHEVRGVRNEVMHFSPDPLTEDQMATLVNVLGSLRVMEPTT